MIRILRAELRRYMKSIWVWLGVLAMLGGGVYVGLQGEADPVVHVLASIATAVIISLLVGCEYSDGGFRNKVISGHGKGRIYLAEWLLGMLFAVLYTALYIAGVAAGGMAELQEIPGTVLGMAAGAALTCTLCFTSVFLVISMLVTNKAVASVVNLLLLAAVTFSGLTLSTQLKQPEFFDMPYFEEGGEMVIKPEENPRYVGGIKRTAASVAVEISPYGHAVDAFQLFKYHQRDYYSAEDLEELRADAEYFPVWALAFSGGVVLAGYCLFRKKDLK